MTKFELNGVTFCNFGSNNYSHGMELITCYPMPENMVERVLNGEFHGVWLNPSCDCSGNCSEFYGVFGTPEQYYGLKDDGLYYSQQKSQIAKRYFQILGGWDASRTATKEEQDAADAQARAEYKDWWVK